MVLVVVRLGVRSRHVVESWVGGLTGDDSRGGRGRLLFDIIQRVTLGLHLCRRGSQVEVELGRGGGRTIATSRGPDII